MADMGEVTGKDGVVEIDDVAVAVSDFNIKADRDISTYYQVGQTGELSIPARLKISGELTRMMINGKLFAMTVGEDVDGAWSTIGNPKKFKLEGILDTNGHKITLTNCYFIGAIFKFSDADAIVEETFPFRVVNPYDDISGSYT